MYYCSSKVQGLIYQHNLQLVEGSHSQYLVEVFKGPFHSAYEIIQSFFQFV